MRLDPHGVRRLCTEIFCADGVPRKNAEIIADNLVSADLRGVASHGVARIKSYMQRSKDENWNPDPKITCSGRGAVCLVDGDDGFGSVVGVFAMKKAMSLAKEHGIGLCSVHRSSHFGMAAYYTLLAVEEDMVGFCCTNGVPNLAPYGSVQGMLGTNPISLAAPMEDSPPMVLDMACSVAARGNIANAQREGQTIPEGWALDRDGNPTTDPAKALVGAVLPFAGYKGSGIGIMVDVLCGVLNGGTTSHHVCEDTTTGPNVGHTMIALDIAAFQDPAVFKKEMLVFADEIRNSRKAPGFDRILVPGEKAAELLAYNLTHGIEMGQGAFRELCEVCEAYGISDDPHQYILEK